MRASSDQAPGAAEFAACVASLRQGDEAAAERAFRALLKLKAEAREDFLFHGDERFEAGKRALVAFNNRRIVRALAGKRPRRLLLLLPFCLQNRACPRQISWKIENCRRCGRCAVGELRVLCERYGVEPRVAVRARFAPRIVAETKPDLVLAVACEHEILAGILRIAPRPCYGILNRRPEGPCCNTTVAVTEVESALNECGGAAKSPRRRAGSSPKTPPRAPRRGKRS